MSSVYEQEIEDGVFEDVETSCAALIPVVPLVYETPRLARARTDAGFVAQLIATAQQLPQTRSLRRAASADALSAYSAQQRQISGGSIAARPANLERAA